MSVTLIQYNDGKPSNGQLAFLSNVTAGNFLLCVAETVDGITDTLGNSWLRLQSFASAQTVYYCPITLGGPNTVTNLLGNSYMAVAEFSPATIQAFSPLASASLTSAAIAGAANELLVGWAFGSAAGAITGAAAGFTYESVNEPGFIALEYQALSGSGSVNSSFTGTAAHVITGAFTLATPLAAAANTPTLVQFAETPIDGPANQLANPVTAGDFLFVMAILVGGSGGNMTISDTLNNTWTLLTSETFFDGSEFCQQFTWYCARSKGGFDTINISGGDLCGILEFTPSAIAGQSALATGPVSTPTVSSAAIAALAGQMLMGYGNVLSTSNARLVAALAGFQGIPQFYDVSLEIQVAPTDGNYSSVFATEGSGDQYLTGIIALASTYSVSGNAGAAGATVAYSGTASGTVTADGSGNYSIPGLPNGSYTITPSVPGRTFTPTSSNQTVNGANISNVNFTENALPFTAGGFSPSFVAQNEGGLRIYVSPGGINGSGVNGQFVAVPPTSQTYVWVYSNGVIAAGPQVPSGAYAIALVTSAKIQVSGTGNPNSGAYILGDGITEIQDLRMS